MSGRRERCNCVGRLGDPLSELPGEDHERGSPGCVHRLTRSEGAWLIAIGAAAVALDALEWVSRKWKAVRHGG